MNDDLMVAILNKVNEVLTGGDDKVTKYESNYINWCLPGIPFKANDLQFLLKGINGKDAEETQKLVRTAAEFSRVANYVPSSYEMDEKEQKKIWSNSGKLLWSIYNNTLQFSEVAHTELSDEQKTKIKKFRGLFKVEKEVTNIVTDKVEIKVEDGPMVKAYNEKESLYNQAALVYNNKRLSALNEDNKESVQDFALNADIYRNKVKSAMDDWITNGYKLDVEEINAFITQTSQKDLTLLKRDLQDQFRKGSMSDPSSGGDFYYTNLYPGSFIETDDGWTKFTFSQENKDTYSKETHKSTSGSAGINLGLWKIGGSGSSSKSSIEKEMNSSDFKIEFSITQASIARPWFSPEFLLNTAWRFKKDTGQENLSNGEIPAEGQLVAYPTTAIFIKDLKITSSKLDSLDKELENTISGGGSLGWGPFNFGGANHKESDKAQETHYHREGNTITVDGMQMIALKCFRLPKTPNPSPDIKSWT